MSVTSFSRADLVERQRAFTGLLAHQLVNPWTRPALYALVTRHEHTVDLLCGRLDYRLVRIDQSYRLRRKPIDGQVAAPVGSPLPRRPLVLALLIAAVLEDHRQDSVTLQEISDVVRHFAAANEFAPYDPEQRSHRRALLAAVDRLADLGVLDRRTRRGDLLESWERVGTGIGAGYLIHRDALVLLVDTRDVQLALDPTTSADDSRSQRLLRRLVETQALHPRGLEESDLAYLTSQGRRLQDQTEEMTGGTVERRADAWVLVLPSDHDLDPDLTVAFPEPTAADWVTLAMIDATGRRSTVRPDGRRGCASHEVDACSEHVFAMHSGRLTVTLKESPAAVRLAAQERLREIGLLALDGDDWLLEPEAGRYRSAELTVAQPADPPATLFEDLG